ncbi:hypothetical protein AgCh_000785 [Apium graveolens]
MHSAEDLKPTSVTIDIILPVCARARALGSVHSYTIKNGLELDTLVGNLLVSIYAKFGLICDDAIAVFHIITEKDVVSWNAMISGFAENKFTGEAFKLFYWMLKESVVPNCATIANILPVCASVEEDAAHHFGKEIHNYDSPIHVPVEQFLTLRAFDAPPIVIALAAIVIVSFWHIK